MKSQPDIQANLPLSEATYFILLSLSLKSQHGYAIMKDVRSLSHNRVVLSTGTLYGALKRLLELEWIQRSDDPEPNHTNRKRNFYRLTDLGQQVLNAEILRLDGLVAAAQDRLVDGNIPGTEAPV